MRLIVVALNYRLASKSAGVGTSVNGLLRRLFVLHILIIEGLPLNSLLHGATQIVMLQYICHMVVYILNHS